jgi:hypothetical protein
MPHDFYRDAVWPEAIPAFRTFNHATHSPCIADLVFLHHEFTSENPFFISNHREDWNRAILPYLFFANWVFHVLFFMRARTHCKKIRNYFS